jgi:CRAL/TRIO domain
MQGVAKAFLELASKHYPERLGMFVIVGAPAIFKGLYNALQPFLDPVTKQKILLIQCVPPVTRVPPGRLYLLRCQLLYARLPRRMAWRPETHLLRSTTTSIATITRASTLERSVGNCVQIRHREAPE